MTIELRVSLGGAAPRDAGTEIVLGSGARHRLAELCRARFGARPSVLAGDEAVLELWQADLGLSLSHGWFALPRGEACKTPEILVNLCRGFAQLALPRDAYVVALGGGAALDLVGLAAACYMRGIDVVHVPSSLVAMVDAALGGKCAVDLPEGKNLLGAFWNARLLVVDPDLLETLPEVEFRAGLGEVLKYALGFSGDLFTRLEAGGAGDLAAVIETCVRIKAKIVEADPWEAGDGCRVRLNLGHTTAHAIEALAASEDVRVPHGLAVGLGLRVACTLACEQGWLSELEHARVAALLDRHALPRTLADLVPFEVPPSRLLEWLQRDKKHQAGKLRVVLPRGVGACDVTDLEAAQLAECMARL